MKDFIDVVPFLQSYEAWVKWLVVTWLLLTAILGAVLLFANRVAESEPQVNIDDFRLAFEAKQNDLMLDILVRNPLSQTAQLVELRLAFFGEQKPRGGLQSSKSESATYLLADGADSDILSTGGDWEKYRYQTKIKYPFTGQNYAEVSIPLSQSVNKGKTDRFIVRFETRQLPEENHQNIEAVIRYNGDLLTDARTINLRN